MLLRDNQFQNSLIKISDHKEIQIMIDADLLFTRLVRCQRKVYQILMMLSLLFQILIVISQFNLLMMVLLLMIAFKEILVIAGWFQQCLSLQLEMNSLLEEEPVWNMMKIWSSIKKLLQFFPRVCIHQFSKNSERLVFTSLEFSKTLLGFTLLLMKEYQLAKRPNYQFSVVAEILMKFGYQLLKKHMQRFMVATRISSQDM